MVFLNDDWSKKATGMAALSENKQYLDDSSGLYYYYLGKQAAFRFSPTEDIALLKEVVRLQRFNAKHGKTKESWAEVASGVAQTLKNHPHRNRPDGLACQRRYGKLSDAFSKNTMAALHASGTDEEYKERDQLLQDLSDPEKEAEEAKRNEADEKKEASNKREARGVEIVKAAMEQKRSKTPGISFTSRINVKESNALPKREVELWENQLALQKKQLHLAEKEGQQKDQREWEKFELERNDRKTNQN
ncbi:hypothetical protein DFJ73DRAFT_958055 [Zopfochytrium polystomum]|nr:hypothetical protein DFJ73DRAFT_958055 [Zopfochytrium polystomum]